MCVRLCFCTGRLSACRLICTSVCVSFCLLCFIFQMKLYFSMAVLAVLIRSLSVNDIHFYQRTDSDRRAGELWSARYEIVVCLQLYMIMNGCTIKLLDEQFFSQLPNTLDNRIKELSRMGCVKPCIQARVITLEEEELVWQSDVLGSSGPKQFVETLLYLFGLHFAL